MKTFKRVLSLVLVFVMLTTMAPMEAIADVIVGGSGSATAGPMLTVVDPDDGSDSVKRITVSFKDGETLLDTQVVVIENGEITSGLSSVAATAKDDRHFIGWDPAVYDYSASDWEKMGTVVDVQPAYEELYYVYFMSTDGSVVVRSASAAKDGTVTAYEGYEPIDARVTLWKDEAGNTYAPGSQITVTGDMILTPETVNCYWVTFDTQGQGSVDSIHADADESVDLSKVVPPERTGYTFGGWKNADGNTVTSLTVSESVTLTAIWEPANVKYTVVYWGENANDDSFGTLLGSESKTGKTDSIAPAATGKTFNYFTYKETEKDVVINADGSTVVNVYYTRNRYKVTFNFNDSSYNTKAKFTINGQTYTTAGGGYSLTAKYEQDISDLWPTASNVTVEPVSKSSGGPGGSKTTTYHFVGWSYTGASNDQTSKVLTMTENFCKTEGVTCKAHWEASINTFYLHYMFESVPGEAVDKTKNNVNFTESAEYSQTAYANATSWGHKAISGMTAKTSWQEITGNSGKYTVYLYYTRNSYTLQLNNYGNITTSTRKFGYSLSDIAEPARPAGFSDKAEFKGWYTVPVDQITEAAVPVDLSTLTMPASNLSLYAYWAEPKITVNIQVSIGNEVVQKTGTFPAGTPIAKTDIYAEVLQEVADQGRSIEKWTLPDGSPVDINKQLYEDTVVNVILVGQTFRVSYDLDSGTGTAPVDAHQYKPGSAAKVLAFTGTAPEGKIFLCWTDGNRIYYPGDSVAVNSNVILKAVYGDPAARTSVIYHSNYPDNSDSTVTDENLLNNGRTTTKPADLFAAPKGYRFVAWNEKADGTGQSFAANAGVIVNNLNGENHLYAQWENAVYHLYYYNGQTLLTIPESGADVDYESGDTVTVTNYEPHDNSNKHMLLGWSTDPTADGLNGNGNYVVNDADTAERLAKTLLKSGDQLTFSNADIKMWAIWADKQKTLFTVTYDPNGGNWDGDTADKVFPDLFKGSATPGVADPARPGYKFDGWKPAVAATVTENVTYVAQWSKQTDLSYTVHYYWNGTTEQVAEDNAVNGQTYGDTVIASPISIEGCTPVSGDNKSITIAESGNEITFYYYKNVELTANSYEKIYNGSTYTVGTAADDLGYTVSNSAAAFEGITTSGTGTDADTYDVTFDQNDVIGRVSKDSKYYVVGTINGQLLITPITDEVLVTVIGNESTVPYNGSEQSVSGYTWTAVLNGTDVKSQITLTGPTQTEAAASGTNANTYPMGLKPEDFNAASKNYKTIRIEVTDGKLIISRVKVTLVSDDLSRAYNGTELVNGSTPLKTESGWISGEGAAYTFTGSRTLVGQSDNSFEYKLNDNTNKDNYDIDALFGKLTVTDDTDIPGDKTHTAGTYRLGDTVTFTLTATNMYETAATIEFEEQTGVSIKQSKFENVAPGVTVTTEATYKIQEQDILAGNYTNTVNIKIGNKTTPKTDIVEVEDKKSALSVTKTSNKEGQTVKLGDEITYTITVENTGNVTIKGIRVEDNMEGLEKGNDWTTNFDLGPTEKKVMTATYTVTQDDIDKGATIRNVVTAEGTDPNGGKPGDSDEETNDPEKKNPGLDVAKNAKGGKITAAGQTITYVVTATNTGNVRLTAPKLNDTKAPAETKFDKETIEPGDTATATYIYTVTQDDMDKGQIDNTAIVTTKDPDGENVTDTDTETVDGTKDPDDPDDPVIVKDPSLDVAKNAKGGKITAAGQTITYVVTATNTGNVRLTAPKLNDTKAPAETKFDKETIEPGDTATATYIYTVTQDDMDKGQIDNTAIVTTKDPDGENVTDTDTETVDGTKDPDDPDDPVIVKDPGLDVAKNAKGGEITAAGQTITYVVTATNTGNVRLTTPKLNDTKAPAETKFDKETIEPGDTATATYIYTVTQDDMDKGQIDNTAIVTAKDPDGENVTDTDTETVNGTEDPKDPDHPVIKQEPKLVVTKTSDKEGKVVVTGETIAYTVTVTNTGNVTIDQISILDQMSNGVQLDFGQQKLNGIRLAPGKSHTVTAQYTVTEADIQAGKIILNSATAQSSDPKNPEIVPDDTENPVDKPRFEIVLQANSLTEVYNGMPKTVSGYRIVSVKHGADNSESMKALPIQITGQSFRIGDMAFTIENLTAGATGTHVLESGNVTFTDNGVRILGNGENVTGLFTIALIPGRLNITPRHLHLTSDSGTKAYDGTALTVDGVSVGGDGFVKGEGQYLGYKMTGAQINPGASKNTFDSWWNSKVPNADVLKNLENDYYFTYGYGTLTVYPDQPQTHRLIIHYVYADGSEAAPDYEGTYNTGDAYSVISPAIADYTPDKAVVASEAMPNADVEVTVTYYPNEPESTVPETVPEEDGYELITVDEEETPQAGDDGEHMDCILHFLLLCAAFIVECVYIDQRKKRQQRIFELKKQLGDTSMDDEEKM